MKAPTRAWLKRVAPAPLRSLVERARSLVAPPPIDAVVLASHGIDRDESERPRLSLVVPMLRKGSDFGGVATGIDIFFNLLLAAREEGELDVRLIVTDVVADTDPGIVTRRAAKLGIALHGEQVLLVKGVTDRITVRRREVFCTYNWWTTLNFAKVRDLQAAAFGTRRLPLVWTMQDYEPGFMGFSSAHLLAWSAYDATHPLWGIVNSSSLADYIDRLGHRFEERFVFEPVIPDALRPFLGKVATSARRKQILVYGRASVERNCFPALVRGLRHWARAYPQFRDWDVLSAGMAHDPIPLGDGRAMVSVGKLSLADYAAALLESSVGISLMASPHPSYPPLEMATFGLRTVTNRYVGKDLASFHPGIVSVPSIAEESLSAAIAEACARHGEPVGVPASETYLRAEAYPFLPSLRDALMRVLAE